MSYIAVLVEALVDCPKCGAGIPLNGAAESVLCGQCQHVLELSPRTWTHLAADGLAEATGHPMNRANQAQIFMGGMQWHLTCGHVPVRCQGCKTPYPDADVAAVMGGGTLTCGSCGRTAQARPAPAWFADVMPAADLLVNETLAADRAAPDDDDEPIKLHCISCGAGLEVDGDERNVPCVFCGERTYLPDKIWLRLHPTPTQEPWLVVIDAGDAVGLLPREAWQFCDLAPGTDGRVVVAYHADDDGDAGHPCRIAAADRRGMLRWLQDGVEFSDEARLLASPGGGPLLLVDEGGGLHDTSLATRFVRFIDPADGAPIRTIRSEVREGQPDLPPSALRGLSLDYPRGYCLDADGTILVLQYGDTEDEPTLTRYAPDGTPLPLWPEPEATPETPAPKRGLWQRLTSSLATDTADSVRRDVEPAAWGSLPARVAVPPRDVVFAVGADGVLYLADERGGHLAGYDRSGTLRFELSLVDLPAERVRAVAADAAGTVYLLFEHADEIDGSRWSHVARIPAGGSPTLWLGPHAGAAPESLGPDDEHMQLGADGLLYIGDEMDSLRIVDPADGRAVWRSPATVSADRERARELDEARRKTRKAVPDREG